MATRVTTDTAIALVGLNSFAESLVWSPDGRFLYVGTKDKGLAAFNVEPQQWVYLVGGNDTRVHALAISPDGKTIAAGLVNDGSIRLLAADTGDLLQTIWPAHEGWPQVIAFSPTGELMASGGDDGRILLWDVATGKMIKELSKGTDWVWGLAFSPNGRILMAGFHTEYQFRVWDTKTWALANTFDGDQAADLAFSPDGSKVVTAGGGIHEANLWDVRTGKQLFNLREAPGWVWAVAYDPKGKFVASGGIGEVVILWDVATGKPAREFYTGPDFIQALAFSPDGTKLASAGLQVLLWDMTLP